MDDFHFLEALIDIAPALVVALLIRWVYARNPDAEEMKIAMAHLAKHSQNKKNAWEDIIWALINTKEFLFNH